MSAGKIVIVEGNISAGKSTLSRDINALTGWTVFLEPTVKNPYLTKFYADPKKYALKMQMWLLKQRFYTYTAALRTAIETGNNVLLDRSVFSDIVFAVKNRDDGNISEEGFEYYLQLRNQMLEGLPVPHITVFLNVSPEVCYERVHRMRCRDCETGIPLEYLSGLHRCYLDFIALMRKSGSFVIEKDWSDFGGGSVRSMVDTVERAMRSVAPLSASNDGCRVLYDRRAIAEKTVSSLSLAEAEDDEGVMPPADESLCDDDVDSGAPSAAAVSVAAAPSSAAESEAARAVAAGSPQKPREPQHDESLLSMPVTSPLRG